MKECSNLERSAVEARSGYSAPYSLTMQVWDDVRGGKLDQLACNNMMTFAADITGTDKLDRAAFSKLCEHFT